MTGRRLALVIANSAYENSALQALRSPSADAAALVDVLTDPEIAGFEVDVLTDGASHEVLAAIDDRLSDTKPDDLVLLHFSGHGLKDESGQLYLAARNTRPERLSSTAVPAEFLQRIMDACRARRLVLLLDCCFGGAFGRGVRVRASGSANVLDSFPAERAGGGRGRAVISASSSMEFALEGSRLANDKQAPSLFTHAVVEGMRSGDADLDGDGLITLDELYDYVFDRVRDQNPKQSPTRRMDLEGDLVLARSGRTPEPIASHTGVHVPSMIDERRPAAGIGFLSVALVGGAASLLTLAVLSLPFQRELGMLVAARDLLPVTAVALLLLGAASVTAFVASRRAPWRPTALGLSWSAAALAAVVAVSGWWIQVNNARALYQAMPLSLAQVVGILALIKTYLVTRAASRGGVLSWNPQPLRSGSGVALAAAGALGAAGLMLQFLGYGFRSNAPAAFPLVVSALLALAMPIMSSAVAGRSGVVLRLGWAAGLFAILGEGLLVGVVSDADANLLLTPANEDLYLVGLILLAGSLVIMLVGPPLVRLVQTRSRKVP